MATQMIDLANFAAGIQDAPAFGGDGASRMKNYQVLPDGEVARRKGYVASDQDVTHITSDGFIGSGQTGPLVIIQNSAARTFFFRLPEGSSWVHEKDRLFFTVPPQGAGFDPSGYWVDLTQETITSEEIYRWTTNTDNMGDAQRPDRDRIVPEAVHGGSIVPDGVSHPFIFGLTQKSPTSEEPIEIVLKVGARSVDNFKISIKVDNELNIDDFLWTYPRGDNYTSLVANQVYAWDWYGTDAEYHSLSERGLHAIKDYWLWIFGGPLGGLIDYFFVPDPEALPTTGEGVSEITQEQFEKAYLEIEYSARKYRYYLHSHRDANTGAAIAASIQAGLQVGATGLQVAGPYGAAAGAAVAVGGIASTLLNSSREGERVALSNLASPLRAGEPGSGFQPGQYVFCHTYSYDEERNLESIPSRTTEFALFDFENVKQAGRTIQRIQITMRDPSKDQLFNWANYLNIYAARTDNPDADEKLAQGLGLDFQLIHQEELPIGGLLNIQWADEELMDPPQYLESTDNDLPTRTLDKVVSYGSRIWGVDETDQSIRYSKLGPHGYHFFPNENALIPQNITLDKSESPITKIHPAPNDSMLYVFKSDTIHFLRGHGEIRGLFNPNTPVDIDLDASVRKDNIGTSYPRSVTTLKDIVLFLGSDRILYAMSGMSVEPFAIAIQPQIDKYETDEYPDLTAENVLAFEYRNCYHLCMPNEVIVLDLQKRYWTIFDWQIQDVSWLQGVQNTLYALVDNQLVRLNEGDTDNGSRIDCEYETNTHKLGYQQLVSGVHVYHDEQTRGKLKVGIKVNNGEYQERTYRPAAYNRFRQGFHQKGQRVQVRVRDENTEKLRIDRIQLEVQV